MKRAASRQQVFVGFGIICIATLMFLAVIKNLISSYTEPSPEPNTIMNDVPISSASGLSKAQVRTILSSIAELKDLITESTASLHQNLDGSKATANPISFKQRLTAICVVTCTFGRRNQEVNNAVLAASLIGSLSAFVWALGLVILTDGLYKISITLRNRVWGCGLAGANIGLAYLLAGESPEHWVSYFTWTLFPMYVGMLGGLLSDRETFFAE